MKHIKPVIALMVITCLAPLPAMAQSPIDPSHFQIAGKGGKNKPFVIVVPGSGGNVPGRWMSAATGAGFGAVGVNLGRIHGSPLYDVSAQTMAASVARAVQAGKDAGFDTSRYAVIGVSKGGTVALISPSYATSAGHPPPKAVFALYPGSMGWCPGSSAQKVHIFYGDADEWGNFRGTRQACAAQAGGNLQYHEFKGAHHGYDGSNSGSFSCCGGQFKVQPDGNAASRTMAIIRRELASIK